MSSIERLSLLQKALSSLRDTFDVLLKADKPKEYKEWTPSRKYSSNQIDKVKSAMDTHGFNMREASVHSGVEPAIHPKSTAFTPFSEKWLKHAKEHAAHHFATEEAKIEGGAKPEHQPILASRDMANRAVEEHKEKTKAGAKPSLNALLSDIREKNTANKKANNQYKIEDIASTLSGGAQVDSSVPLSEDRIPMQVKNKVSKNNPLSKKDVTNYLFNNAGHAAIYANDSLKASHHISGGDNISEYNSEVTDGLLRALHSYDPKRRGENFPSHAASIISNLVRQGKEHADGYRPASNKQALKATENPKEKSVVKDNSALGAKDISEFIGRGGEVQQAPRDEVSDDRRVGSTSSSMKTRPQGDDIPDAVGANSDKQSFTLKPDALKGSTKDDDDEQETREVSPQMFGDTSDMTSSGEGQTASGYIRSGSSKKELSQEQVEALTAQQAKLKAKDQKIAGSPSPAAEAKDQKIADSLSLEARARQKHIETQRAIHNARKQKQEKSDAAAAAAAEAAAAAANVKLTPRQRQEKVDADQRQRQAEVDARRPPSKDKK